MIQLRDVSLFIDTHDGIRSLLGDINFHVPSGHLVAVIGPSGCGKSTLLKCIAGVAQGEEEGAIQWKDRDLKEKDFLPSEIGYVPQFSIAHDALTARESVASALRLRVGGKSSAEVRQTTNEILEQVGLTDAADRLVKVLSGGQKRRLALAMELVSEPEILLCDEVTSGLDPRSEEEVVRLMARIAHDSQRTVVSVTHSLRHLKEYDSIIVLYEGGLIFHGKPSHLIHYFNVSDPHEIFSLLDNRKPEEWQQSWKKHKISYEIPIPENERIETASESIEAEDTEKSEAESSKENSEKETKEIDETHQIKDEEKESKKLLSEDEEEDKESSLKDSKEIVLDIEAEIAEEEEEAPLVDEKLPSAMEQFLVLLGRRYRIFFRSKGQFILQLGLILGFPVLVAIFAWNGLPQVQNLSLNLDKNVLSQLTEAQEFLKQATRIGTLISGITMFQVILLTLMGANNAGREIASERLIFEKEKLAGVRPSAYVASKAVFLGGLVLVQSLWMGFFVHSVCGFPGNFMGQLVFLILVNAAMTSVCLAISSWMATAEQASLVSIYLVGFQLPLSGAVLALPTWIGEITRPFIAAYWSWSGILQTLKSERYYDIVSMVVQTSLSSAALCLYFLLFHVLIGGFLAWKGCQKMRWE